MHRFTLIVVAGLLLLACGGCGKQPAGQLSSQDEELFRQAAAKLVDDFAGELKGKLTEAIAAGGPSNAIYVCRSEAPKVATANSHGGWAIGRVSDRYRNPANAANSDEVTIMADFADTLAPAYFERWEKGDSLSIYHYYQPIRTQLLCLKCHGTESNMDEVVAAAVHEYYPDDLACDYDIGDLRGLFVVTAEWPTGEERAREMTKGAN
ncbi:MAG: DUF3365 domain-containing protein [bacterium]